MQFLVPQFVDVEDKIVGPLTLRQFLYIAAAVGISMILFFMVQTWLWFILSVFIIGGAAALALVKINGQPLFKVAMSAIGFYWTPQTYVWQPESKKQQKAEIPSAKQGHGFSLEKIVAGLSLRKSWQSLQTGSKYSVEEEKWGARRMPERYEIVKKATGEKQAVRRVDYR